MMARYNFTYAILFTLCVVTSALASSRSVRTSFTIKPGDESVQSLKLATSDGELVFCAFKYSTKRRSSGEEDLEASVSVRRPSVQSILGRLSGICIRKTIDYWKYEVCFEGEIKQVHGQVQNNLGRFSGLDGALQVYDEGTPCETKSERRYRNSKIEFVCDKQLRIRAVDEVTTCSYLVVVGTPIVCGSADFAIAPADKDIDGLGQQNNDETWLLEMWQVGKSKVECSARTLTSDIRLKSDRQALTTLEFSNFNLEMSLTSDSPAALAHDLHVVRGPDRTRLNIAEREYSLHTGTSSRDSKVKLESSSAFNGALEFINLVVRIIETSAVNI